MAGLGPIVAALWKELGMAPPVETIGAEFEFELGEMLIRLDLQDNGDTVTVRGRIGFLEGNAHEAGDQLSRVLRLGLGLAALNGAVLDAAAAEDILDNGHEGPVPIFALATASLAHPETVLQALRAVLDWQSVTGSILTQDVDEVGQPGSARPGSGPSSDAEMIIFQP